MVPTVSVLNTTLTNNNLINLNNNFYYTQIPVIVTMFITGLFCY